ncbi:hypothetical protein PIIN_08125 [Serendipita indica DSM 11827]|uniref:Uncharacterized protein n=1 Tax=Serendipita indica (strain DSM 11827) TaxID=1109443 RepID=G4TS79_SERID|nr:hypothetical protein PIIN_08125 [Serendipita indica DSM 11827]
MDPGNSFLPNNPRYSGHPEAYSHLYAAVPSSSTFSQQTTHPSLSSQPTTTSASLRIAARIVKLAVTVFVLTLGIGLGLLAYILNSRISWTSTEVITAVPQGNVLLITATASKFVLTCVPLVMGLAAYTIAHGWLGASTRKQADGMPTPYQYTLLLGLFQGANPVDLWRTLRYLVRGTGRRSSTSYLLIYAFIILFITLVLSYLLVGLDFALHSLSTTRHVSVIGAQIDTSILSTTDLYGATLRSDCNSPDKDGNACTIKPIGALGPRQSAEFQEGIRLIADSSSKNRISYTSPSPGKEETIAIFTPALQPDDKTFRTRTTAVSTSCTPFSSACDLQTACDATYHYPLAYVPPEVSVDQWWPLCTAFACEPPTWPKYWSNFRNDTAVMLSEPLEQRGEDELVEVDAEMQMTKPTLVSANPFRVIVNVASYLDTSILDEVCAQKTDDGNECIKGKDDGYLYSGGANPKMGRSARIRYTLLGCTVSILDVIYTYLNRTYTIESSSLSDQATTQALSTVLYASNSPLLVRDLSNSLTLLATSGASSKEVGRKVSEEIGRTMLGLGHGAFDSSLPVERLATVHEVLATVIPTWTLVAFIVSLGMFALLGIVLAGLATMVDNTAFVIPKSGPPGRRGNGEDQVVNVIDIARRRLCEPTGLVYEAFEKDADTSETRWMLEGEQMFDESPLSAGSWPELRQRRRTVRVGLQDDGFGFHK